MIDLALGGDFRIGFEVTDTEFKIPIYKGSGTVLSDITTGPSGGETQLVKVVLSLALVKQIIQSNNFNILALDETDSELDREKNRERFVSIVDKLINDLGIEQVFIISHNDHFHVAEAGLILLPGHSMPAEQEDLFMKNKIIVADLR
jgi:DNA repair exonuclease SbcCD ATPase subunit